MPFAPVPIYGGGAGVASAVSGIQDRQDRQRDFMLQLLAHAQNQQALQQYRQSQLQQNELVKQQMADAATERANTGASNMRVGQLSRIAAGSDVPSPLAQSPEAAGQVQEQQTLPSRVMSPIAGQTDTTQVSAQPSGRFLKLPSDKDVQQTNMLDLRNLISTNAEQGRNQRASDMADLRREMQLSRDANQPSHFTPVPQYDETGKPIGTAAFDTRRGTTAAVTAPGGGPLVTRAAPGAAQAAQQSAKKKDALDTLDQLDAAIDSAKDLIGPASGRIGGAQQWVGDADPRLQALGTKMLISKMKIDASLGGMRAAASPQILARWDNLLANKVTPEGMKASTQAMREILGGGTGGKRIVYGMDGKPVQ